MLIKKFIRRRSRVIVITITLIALLVFIVLIVFQYKTSNFQLKHKLPAQIALSMIVPTPTLAPGQKAIYTFYIHATSHKTSYKGLGIHSSDSGKIFIVDMGTLVDVDFGRIGNFHVTVTSPQNIFQCVRTGCLSYSSTQDSIYSTWVTHPGSATIQVTESK